MTAIPGGRFTMGSDRFYPEERPARAVRVSPFFMDTRPVTNAEFRDFVRATGYTTVAETPPAAKDYPGMLPEMARAGSAVFKPPGAKLDLGNPMGWWGFTFGASWRRPLGPHTSIRGIENHPVVHIAYKDAEAYAAWAGKSLPTEAEWEFAARGGLEGVEFAWGDELEPGGPLLANYWQGQFPVENLALDGWERTSPVGAFPPNGYGLFDMIGNVWEWTSDWYGVADGQVDMPPKSCCAPLDPKGGVIENSYDAAMPNIRIGRKVLKGGSHLCAENYCQRYRPAARHPQAVDTSTSHVGFRCVVRPVVAAESS